MVSQIQPKHTQSIKKAVLAVTVNLDSYFGEIMRNVQVRIS